MFLWLTANWGTIAVLALLSVGVLAALRSIRAGRKQGKTSCGCNCADCRHRCGQ